MDGGLVGWIRNQVGLTTDTASNIGTLHAKLVDIRDNYLTPTLGDAYVSDTLRISADTERVLSGAHAYTKKKEIRCNVDGNIRIAFDAKGEASTYARIYKNNVAAGTERTPTSEYTTYTEDFACTPGDLFEIYLRSDDVSSDVYCRNFRIYYDVVVATAVVLD